ncbi:MAG: hypothetical protein ACREDM_13075 [Methylocella sp.]
MQDTDVLDRHWRDEGLSRPLRRAMTFTQAGLVLGRGTLLAEFEKERLARGLALDGNEARLLSLLTAAHGEPVAEGVVEKVRRAGEFWRAGEKTLAQIQLAFIGLPRIDETGAYRLFLAGVALEKGLDPSDLMKALGFPRAARGLEKYNPEQRRVPAGSGRESGQWTSGGDSAGVSAPPAAAAPASLPPAAAAAAGEGAKTLAADLFAGVSPRFLAGLAELGATIGGAGAVLGTIFIPSPNPGLTSEGAVPGDPGLRYAINHDENTLRLTRQDSTGAELAVVAQRGPDAVFYEVQTGTPIARDVGGSIVFDAATLASATAAPRETTQASDRAAPSASAEAKAEPNQPKLCPAPEQDAPHGASDRAKKYQEQISALNNPQRPLPAWMAVSLVNSVTGKRVRFDDCRESDGTMIEAKGHRFAYLLGYPSIADSLAKEWVDQATRQVEASGGRAIEWYFAEKAAADRAREIFDRDSELRRIRIFTVPAEAS